MGISQGGLGVYRGRCDNAPSVIAVEGLQCEICNSNDSGMGEPMSRLRPFIFGRRFASSKLGHVFCCLRVYVKKA